MRYDDRLTNLTYVVFDHIVMIVAKLSNAECSCEAANAIKWNVIASYIPRLTYQLYCLIVTNFIKFLALT